MELVEAVLKLREEYTRWDKDKLVVLLHREGFDYSASMVGRIIHKLKERDVLREPSNPPIGQEEAVAATLCCQEDQRIPG